MGPDVSAPTSLAEAAACRAAGAPPRTIRRFSTGLDHYVFEATFADRPPLVVRLGDPHRRARMAAGLRLHGALRDRGVPLPEIVAAALDDPWPWIVLERLAGTDLGAVIDGLSQPILERIAARVSDAQAIVATLPSAGRYGYAADPYGAPLATWSRVLDANLARARPRLLATRLFDPSVVDVVAHRVGDLRSRLDALPAVPFLHDTTTKNVIVTADGVFSGVVDVDDLCFGDPRYAPALTLAALLASRSPTAYVDHWMQHARFRDDAVFRLYVALFLVDLMSEHGQRFNDNPPPSTETRRAILREAFTDALR
ncbi:MAG: aminoglycoside phosphotransferase family protein, partial [Alphaproteobacteria bacterium]|nr:aminoglycoside phosphotransferase family protein [Alphaproteobacteria bacterium]